MPRTRFRGQQVRRRSSNKAWTGVGVGQTTIAVSSKVLLGTVVLSNPNIDETILRTVGVLGVESDQIAASETQLGAFGMIVVSDQAVSVGASAIPGPVSDIGDDGWFVYVPILQSLVFGSAIGFDPSGIVQYNFDSKAKRKIQEGETVALIIENAGASFVFNAGLRFRLLSMVTGT